MPEKNVRRDPLGLLATAGVSGSKVTSRLDLDTTTLCTVCKKPMKPILAHDIPAYVCWEHRVVLPQENAVAAVQPQPEAVQQPPVYKVETAIKA